ncbi:MAG: hypothetical protein WCD35_00005, partial [Mycobacteriales bacterium]
MLSPRVLLRVAVVGGLTGAVGLSAAWAGIGIAPVPAPAAPATRVVGAADLPAADSTAVSGAKEDGGDQPLPGLAGGEALVGAAKMSIAPRPKDMAARFPGARWETDPAECKTLDQHEVDRLTGGHAT